jgi:cadherin 23
MSDFNRKVIFQDFNDHAPIFVSPPRNQTIRVYENATVDSEVTRVKAVDVDIGSNGAVRYRLRQDPLGNHKSFSVDEITGVVTLRKELDRENQKIYDLRVEAHDLGVPTQLQVKHVVILINLKKLNIIWSFS